MERNTSEPGVRLRVLLPWLLWLVLLAGWTYALLTPDPPRAADTLVPDSLRFYFAKGLHLCAYAFLAFLVCWLPAGRSVRLGVWIFLAVHAALTEVGQRFVDGRFGSVEDVGIDVAGILLGIGVGLASRRLFPLTPRPPLPQRGEGEKDITDPA